MRKSTKLILIFFLIAGVNLSKARKDSLKLFRLYSITAACGIDYHQRDLSNQTDFARMAPQNTLINSDISSYTNLQPKKLASPSNLYFTALLGFKRLNKKSGYYYSQRENRIGLRFYVSTPLLAVYENVKVTHYDTLKTGGNTSYYNINVDNSKHYSYFFQRNNLLFDFGTVFKTGNNYLVTAYAGYNVGLGVSVGSYIVARHSVDSVIENKSYDEISSTTESTKVKNSFIGSVSIPIGINWRLERTKKFWNRCVLNLEFRPGVNAQTIQNYGNYTTLFIGAHFGIKFLL